MADNFNASLVISTSDAVNNVRNLDSASKDLDKTLAHLHTTMQSSQGDIDKVAKSLKVFTETQRQANKDERERNNTLISGAKLEREQIVNQDKRNEGLRKEAQHQAKLDGIRNRGGRAAASGLGNETRRNAESDARIAAQGVLTQARLGTELERRVGAEARTAAAVAQRSSAEARAEMTTLRLAAAQQRANNSNLALNDSLSNSRYLLFDVAQTYTVLSAALLAIPLATTAVAASYEKDFAQVIRTTGLAEQEIPAMLEDLKALGREIPLSFGEFAKIASIAGQLGIDKKEVAAFTETVAKFGAASNVSVSEASTAFGRLKNAFNPDNKIPDFYNRIGSSIAKVGVESAASETEIIAVTNQISAAGAQFGFTAEQIVGMSGALASVRIRPELARGAFQRILLQLSRAADEGSGSFDKFAKYTGVVGQAGVDLFKNDPSAFFNKYTAGIKKTISEGASVSAVLDDIGAKNVFDKQFILGLANGQKVYNKALEDSKTAFQDGTFLDTSTKGVFETFAATLQKIANAFQNVGQALGAGNLETLKPFANTILNVTNAFDRLITQVPAIGGLVNALLGIGAVTGVFLAFKAAQAFVLAGLVGLQQVMGKASIAGALTLRGNMSELAKTMLMTKGASAEMAAGLLANKTTMQQLAFATTATNASLARFAAVSSTAAAGAGVAQTRFGAMFATMRTGFMSTLGLIGGWQGALVGGLAIVGLAFVSAEEKAKQAGDSIARAMKEGSESGNRAIASALTDRTVDSYLTDLGSGGAGNHGKNVRKVAEEIGVDFNKIVAAIGKGKDATVEFQKVQDQFAVSKGFKDFNDLMANSTNLQNSRGEMLFLGKVVKELGDKSAESGKDVKATDDAVKALDSSATAAAPSAEGLAEGLDETGDAAKTAADKIRDAVDAIFGLVDAEAATQESLSKLGAGLQEGTGFGTGTDSGRENLSNFRDTLRAAALEQQQLVDQQVQTQEQAAANYATFIDGLLQQLAAKGVDVEQVRSLAEQAKGVFGDTFASGAQPTLTPKVDATQLAGTAASTTQSMQEFFNANRPSIAPGMDTSEAQQKTFELATALAGITGLPYQVVVDALTNPAHEKTQEVYAALKAVTEGTYTAPIGADTSAFVTNIRNAVDYAAKALASVQNAYNNMAAQAPTFAKYTSSFFKGVKGVTNTAPAGIRAPAMSNVGISAPPPPVQVAAKPTANQFAGLNNGYNNAAKAAKGAGDAGKQAGKDMADGIDNATEAANDYASRLKTALQTAFDKQYGLTKATDDYHSALNAIKKKRADEISQLKDLIAKEKELKNARKADQNDARKAGTEKAISEKYGEVDRAADYAQQEEEALLAAAAKQKDIEANAKTAKSLRAGIDNFKGYSDAAIANREALRNLESKTLDMIAAYAATGKSQEQVRAYAQKLTAQFVNDAAQVWKNRFEIINLTGDMVRYINVVNAVPQHKATTVTANTGQASGALGALGGQLNALKDTNIAIRADTSSFVRDWWDATMRVRKGIYDGINNIPARGPSGGSGGIPVSAFGMYRGGEVEGFAGGGQIGGRAPSNPKKDNRFASVDGKGLIQVRSGEYIVKQPAVDYWGLDFMKNINNMKMPTFSAGGSVGGRGGGAGSGGPVLVELTAENIAAIQRMPQINLYTETTKLASSVREGNAILASQGVS